jgi:hypothetical protein
VNQEDFKATFPKRRLTRPDPMMRFLLLVIVTTSVEIHQVNSSVQSSVHFSAAFFLGVAIYAHEFLGNS